MTTPRLTPFELMEKLVSFPTVSRDTNLPLIDWVEDYLQSHNVKTFRHLHPDEPKAGLWAHAGPMEEGAVVLSGHTDVVPVDGQDWTTDPFSLTEANGRLYGRGTSDMKSFIALALAAAHRYAERPGRVPLHLSFSYDEEVGCLGVPRLIDDMAAHLAHRPWACIVGEPTGLRVINGHKGKTTVHCRVRGREAHSSLTHKGVNAIEHAGEVLAILAEIRDRIRHDGPIDESYDPPYTTVHVGVIQGGTALNIVPRTCDIHFEFRNLPTHDPMTLLDEIAGRVETEILPRMHETDPDAGISFTLQGNFPPLETDETSDIVDLVKNLTGENKTFKVPFGTEGGLFDRADIPTVVCGPGSIDQAHKPDEFILLEQFEAGRQFLGRLVDHLATA